MSDATANMKRDWREEILNHNEDALFIGYDGDTALDCAIVGIGTRCGMQPVLIYSVALIEKVFTDGGMDPDDASEHVSFNIVGSYLGPNTPIFMV